MAGSGGKEEKKLDPRELEQEKSKDVYIVQKAAEWFCSFVGQSVI